ncbi:MAG: AMP-binding protein [Acidimicrobiales bacterium]
MTASPTASPTATPDVSDTASEGANFADLAARRAWEQGWWRRPLFFCQTATWSHGDIHREASAAARRLADLGVAAGDAVLVATKDRPGLVVGLLGAARLGAMTVLVNPALPAADHVLLAADAAPKVVVCEPELASRFPRCAATVAVDELVADGPPPEGAGTPEAAPDDPSFGPAPLFPPAAAPLYLQYTSGTTGAPKGAMHRHSDPLAYLAAMDGGVLELVPDDVVYSISKAFFAYGLGNSVFFPLLSGCAAVLDPDRPTAESVAANAERHRVTILFAVPTFYARLAAWGAGSGRGSPLASVRLAVSAGETLQPALHERLRSWLGCDVLDGLGSTEVGQTFISNTPGRSRPGTVGTVLPGYQAEARDEAGGLLPPGRIGNLWVRGASVMLGYRNRPEETASVLKGGWCRTGDRASVDDDGYFHLHGRLDDLEVVGGINVSALEVEAALVDHPSVLEIAVASVQDDSGGSRLAAFAVLQPGHSWSPGLEGEILALARQRLAPHKVPRTVVPVGSLPRTATGKLRRHLLRAGWPPSG